MKLRKNQAGFGSFELLTVLVVATILLAFLLAKAVSLSKKEKYKAMRYSAYLMGYNQGAYTLSSKDGTIYLTTLIDQGLSKKIKNPFFGKEEYCDIYESKITIRENKRFLSLQCGSYLIDEEYQTDAKFDIYLVSDWTTEQVKKTKNSSVEQRTAYNYEEKGKEVFATYYPEDLFLLLYNLRNNTSYSSLEEIKQVTPLLQKEFYRTKKLINRIKS